MPQYDASIFNVPCPLNSSNIEGYQNSTYLAENIALEQIPMLIRPTNIFIKASDLWSVLNVTYETSLPSPNSFVLSFRDSSDDTWLPIDLGPGETITYWRAWAVSAGSGQQERVYFRFQ
jgi:hypothetical protein